MKNITDKDKIKQSPRPRRNADHKIATEQKPARPASQLNGLQPITDTTGFHIFSLDKDMRYTEFNSAHASSMYALYKARISPGSSFLDYITADRDRAVIRKVLEDVLSTGKAVIKQQQLEDHHPTGQLFEVFYGPRLDPSGRTEGIFVIAYNVTGAKLMEQALHEYETRLKEAHKLGKIGNWVFDIKTGIVNWSDELFALYERDKKLGPTSIFEKNSYFSHSESLKLKEYGEIVKKKGEAVNYRLEIKLPSGKTAYFDDWMYPIKDADGNMVKLAGTVQDITERVLIEENLRQSEGKLRSVMDASPVGISWMNLTTGKIEYINGKFTEMFGYLLEDIPTIDSWFKHASGIQRDSILRKERFNAEPELKKPSEVVITCKDGSVRDVELMARRAGDYLIAVLSDITEQKQAYNDLKLLAEILNNAYDNIVIFGPNGEYLYLNETSYKSHGYTREEFERLGNDKLIVPGYERRRPQVLESLKLEGEARFETAHFTKDGSIMQLEVHVKKIRLGNKDYILSISRNINDRKKVEQDLKLKAELLDNATDSIFVTDIKGNFLYANKTTIHMLGYSNEELLESNVDRLSAESPERNSEIKRLANASGQYSFEIIYRRKDGSTFPAEVFAKIIEIGGVNYVLSISRDITQRRQSEEELQFRARILNTAIDSIFVWDTDKKCVYVNDAGLQASGYSRDELVGKKLKEFLPADQYERIAGKIDDDLFGKGSLVFEATELSKTNEVIPVEVHSHVIEIGNKKYSASISRNISERKQVENELRLRAELLDSTNDAIFVWDVESGKFTYFNETSCMTHGYTRQEFQNLVIEDIVSVDSPHRPPPQRQGSIIKGHEDIFESIHKRKDGSTFPCEIHSRQIEIHGKPYILSIGRDITRRKEYEKDLEMRAELLDNSSDSVYVVDLNNNFIYFNETTLQSYGYTKEEFAGLKVQDLVADPAARTYRSLTLEKGQHFFESVHRRKDGSTFPCEIQGKLFEMEGKKYILSISHDITQRRHLEEEKKENEKRLLSSMEATILALSKTVEMRDPYTSGHQLRATLLATAIASKLGFTEDKNRGLYLAGIVHDIGKIMIPAEILSKPGKLSEFEFDLIKMHPRAGYDMLKDIKFPWPIAQIVAQHHERIDGSGYPLKLRDRDILPEARILAVADVVEAIASHRPYRAAMGIDLALEEIEQNRGTLYDGAAVDACLDLFRNQNFKFEE